MCKVYGYCRISTPNQSIDRQERNILKKYPSAVIIKEAFTGTKVYGRKKFEALIKTVKSGDTIVFDAVDRMSRNAEEGVAVYMSLYDQGVNLVFIKQPHINTAVYREALTKAVPMTGTAVDCILQGVNEYFKALAAEQVKLAFNQAQAEVESLHKRTSEGMTTAKLNGKQIGNAKGVKLTTKKSLACKEIIRNHSVDFGGTLSDGECIKLAGCSRNSFYKYKRELAESMN